MNRALLGDSHNFGRRVSLQGELVIKPRTVFWEWLLLAKKSPLRRLLDRAAARSELGESAFSFLPSLHYGTPRAREGAAVERLELRSVRALAQAERRELARIVGRSLALFGFLGVADLHWENLVLGRDTQGRLIFGPVDVEMVLADFASPVETKLLPDADPEYAEVCRHAAGVRRVLPYLGKPVAVDDLLAMLEAYARTLSFLEQNAVAIAELLARLPGLADAPIRVCLRGTDEYVRARLAPLWPPLLDAESEQLARGDIPYFFRFYGRRGIHYYAEPSLRELGRLPLAGDVPKLEPLLSLSRALRSPSRRRLSREGLFTVLGAFDHPSFVGRYDCGDMAVTFGARSLVVHLSGGEELHSRRNLRAFVGSVYLPCRCGEVRSVFVPRITKCTAEAVGSR